MKSKIFMALSISLLAFTSTATGQSVYCPQHTTYINIGMTEDQVLDACGEPLSRETSKTLATQKVPVTQLIYTDLNKGSRVYPGLNSAFYDQWSLPSGSKGVSLEVDVINGKVNSVRINGSNTNAMSICNGASVQVGDDANQVYSSCGGPSLVNNTYVNQAVPVNTKPEVWIYQFDQYQSPISLTFVNGKLQSIN